MKITLLYQVSHYIRVKKTKKYKELGLAKLSCYKWVLLYLTSFNEVTLYRQKQNCVRARQQAYLYSQPCLSRTHILFSQIIARVEGQYKVPIHFLFFLPS